MGLYSLWLIIVSTVQTNQIIVFCSFFCLLHTFPAVILYFFPVSASSYIVPDQEKNIFVFIMGSSQNPCSVILLVGLTVSLPFNPRFVSKERVKLLSIHSFPVFHLWNCYLFELFDASSDPCPPVGSGIESTWDRLPPSIPLLSNTEVAAVHNVKRISIRSLWSVSLWYVLHVTAQNAPELVWIGWISCIFRRFSIL